MLHGLTGGNIGSRSNHRRKLSKNLICAGIELTVQVDHLLCDGIIVVTGLRGEPARDPRDLDGDLYGFRRRVISTELCVWRLSNIEDLDTIIDEALAVVDHHTLMELYHMATSEPYSY